MKPRGKRYRCLGLSRGNASPSSIEANKLFHFSHFSPVFLSEMVFRCGDWSSSCAIKGVVVYLGLAIAYRNLDGFVGTKRARNIERWESKRVFDRGIVSIRWREMSGGGMNEIFLFRFRGENGIGGPDVGHQENGQ